MVGKSVYDLQTVMMALYDSEINCSITSFWDNGFTVKFGDEMNGFVAESLVRTPPEAAGNITIGVRWGHGLSAGWASMRRWNRDVEPRTKRTVQEERLCRRASRQVRADRTKYHRTDNVRGTPAQPTPPGLRQHAKSFWPPPSPRWIAACEIWASLDRSERVHWPTRRPYHFNGKKMNVFGGSFDFDDLCSQRAKEGDAFPYQMFWRRCASRQTYNFHFRDPGKLQFANPVDAVGADSAPLGLLPQSLSIGTVLGA
jgi:hypothetical protein